MERLPEFFTYRCPHCAAVRNAAEVVAELDDAVVRREKLRRDARRQTRHGNNKGRPSMSPCPGCSLRMTVAELRDHRVACVHNRLKEIHGMRIELTPKDLDPYPDFYIAQISESEVIFQKGSNHDQVKVDLRKIAKVTASRDDNRATIHVLGRVAWNVEKNCWQFVPTAAVGRPPKIAGVRA